MCLRFNKFMGNQGFLTSKHDIDTYITKLKDGKYMYLLIYVDDMLISCKDKSKVLKIKAQLSRELEMKDLGASSKILGMKQYKYQLELILS